MRKHDRDNLNIYICYKNFAAFQNISHIGLGISALNNCKVLNHLGIRAQVVPLTKPEDLTAFIEKQDDLPTHVIIQAPWIPSAFLAKLANRYVDTQFAVVSHSDIPFLGADTNGVKLIKEYIQLEQSTATGNFHIAGNAHNFTKWVKDTFNEVATFLPNMYYLHHKHGKARRLWGDTGGTLRIGIFGATRTLKNIPTAVAASMTIANQLNAFTEIWISSERDDGPESKRIRETCKQMVQGYPLAELKTYGWSTWHDFKKKLGSMHLLMQPSFTESFNMVTADGVSEGVATVVSDAIDWIPDSWVAKPDDANSIARSGIGLLFDPAAVDTGMDALRRHNRDSERYWLDYLTDNRFGNPL